MQTFPHFCILQWFHVLGWLIRSWKQILSIFSIRPLCRFTLRFDLWPYRGNYWAWDLSNPASLSIALFYYWKKKFRSQIAPQLFSFSHYRRSRDRVRPGNGIRLRRRRENVHTVGKRLQPQKRLWQLGWWTQGSLQCQWMQSKSYAPTKRPKNNGLMWPAVYWPTYRL